MQSRFAQGDFTENTPHENRNAENPSATGGGVKKSKWKKALIVLLVIVIVLLLLAIIFRNQIAAFILQLYTPIGPGGMVNNHLK